MTERITPACAGKRIWILRIWTKDKDHPRVCGEKKGVKKWMDSFHGSPPRVRGKVKAFEGGVCRYRITPACAGKRLSQEINDS